MIELTTKAEFSAFVRQVKAARTAKGLPELNEYYIQHYCQTLINGASVFTSLACMLCNDRLDLVDGNEDGSNPACDALEAKFKVFTSKYLGLELVTRGDPRGAVFKLVLPHERELAVPCTESIICYR